MASLSHNLELVAASLSDGKRSFVSLGVKPSIHETASSQMLDKQVSGCCAWNHPAPHATMSKGGTPLVTTQPMGGLEACSAFTSLIITTGVRLCVCVCVCVCVCDA